MAKPAPVATGNRLQKLDHHGSEISPQNSPEVSPVQPAWLPIGAIVSVAPDGLIVGLYADVRAARRATLIQGARHD
ncbi:hypothetical protein [Microbaculum marinum]|uniref:Uncharacterized protein n=2 Tax=Microbaculum marinum TaxID=1764581 RepID=A0AAW9S1H3_9HYPH